MEPAPELRCHRLRLHDGKLEELRDDVPVVSVAAAELVEARVVRTQLAERPIIQAVIGLGLLALGVIWAIRLITWIQGGGTFSDVEFVMLMWLVAGPFVLAGALRRGLVLRARTRQTTRKLIVGKATLQELRAFAERAQAEHGVRILLDVTPGNAPRG